MEAEAEGEQPKQVVAILIVIVVTAIQARLMFSAPVHLLRRCEVPAKWCTQVKTTTNGSPCPSTGGRQCVAHREKTP